MWWNRASSPILPYGTVCTVKYPYDSSPLLPSLKGSITSATDRHQSSTTVDYLPLARLLSDCAWIVSGLFSGFLSETYPILSCPICQSRLHPVRLCLVSLPLPLWRARRGQFPIFLHLTKLKTTNHSSSNDTFLLCDYPIDRRYFLAYLPNRV